MRPAAPPSLAAPARETSASVQPRPSGTISVIGFVLLAVGLVMASVAAGDAYAEVSPWTGIVVTGVLAIATWRRGSVLATVYLAVAGVNFFVAPLVLELSDSKLLTPPPLMALVWVVAIGAGPLVLGRPPRQKANDLDPKESGLAISWPHYGLACLVVVIHLGLAVGGRLGYRAQLETGISSASGVQGMLAGSAAPFVILLFAAMLATGKRSLLVVGLVAAELLALVVTGFRGAGVTMVIAMGVVYVIMRGRSALRLGFGRSLAVAIVMIALSVGAFVGAAEVKKDIADSTNSQSAGNRVWNPDEALEQLGGRLNSSSYYRESLPFVGNENLGSLAWSSQLTFIIPRAVWPDKPNSDYGQEVTTRVYGLAGVKSSSTISTLGDVHLNTGPFGVVMTGFALGVVLTAIERRARLRPTLASTALLSVVVTVLTDQEQPLGLMLVGLLRIVLIVGTLWYVASRVDRFLGGADQTDGARVG